MSEGLPPPLSPEICARVNQLMAEDLAMAELSARNWRALSAWRARRAAKAYHPDAWPPLWRERLNFWLEERRELAERWMFKSRCARRWSMQSTLPLPAFLRKQAE